MAIFTEVSLIQNRDLLHGQGILNYNHGEYVGEFKDGRYHGKGIKISKDDGTFVGEWKNDKAHGKGIFIFPNGEKFIKYTGEWIDGEFDGQGRLIYADGREYMGEFKDDTFNEQGELTYTDGKKYIGEFKDVKDMDKEIGPIQKNHLRVNLTIKNLMENVYISLLPNMVINTKK